MAKFKFGDKVTYRSCKNAFYLRKTDDIRSLIAVEKFGAIKGAVITVITNELTPASDWVKCSERMPERYELVLTRTEAMDYEVCCLRHDGLFYKTNGDLCDFVSDWKEIE